MMYNNRKRAGINYHKSDKFLKRSLMGSVGCSDIENFLYDELGEINDQANNQKANEVKVTYMSD